MSLPTFYLSGAAIHGVAPTPALAAMPLTATVPVKLGRKGRSPVYGHNTLRLGSYLKTGAAAAVPDSWDYASRAQGPLRRMYGNDKLGDCVIASSYHVLGVLAGVESGIDLEAQDQEVVGTYHRICGPGDEGCYIADVLDAWVRDGLPVQSVGHRADAYVVVNWRDRDLVRFASFTLGNVKLGFNCPEAWLSNAVWDVTDSRIVGGHAVPIVDANSTGPRVASWGRIYQMTWAALADHRYVDEAYCVLAGEWYARAKRSPTGLDVVGLQDDLKAIREGRIPGQPPTPVDPAVPLWAFRTAKVYESGDMIRLLVGHRMPPGRWGIVALPDAHAGIPLGAEMMDESE